MMSKAKAPRGGEFISGQGILYTITCAIPNVKGICMIYGGSTTRTLAARWHEHLYEARAQGKSNALYEAMRQYGVENFLPAVWRQGFVNLEELKTSEQQMITELKLRDRDFGFNCRGGGQGGAVHPESCVKMSKSQQKRCLDPAERERRSRATKKQMAGPEARERLSREAKERMAIPAAREHLSKTAKERLASPAAREQLRERAIKYFTDPAAHERASISQKKRYEDPAELEKLKTAGINGTKTSWSGPGAHARASERMKSLWATQEFREKMMNGRDVGGEKESVYL